VNSILNSVVDTVSADPSRRFVWAESSFLMRWYEVATEGRRELLRAMVAAGQVEFVGGGWVQNDEAITRFEDTIDQLTLGHLWAASALGAP
jgi:alpha-mannosidase II